MKEITEILKAVVQEMEYEKNLVSTDMKYTVEFKEGYKEAVRCMGVVIKELTTQKIIP